tara:strand:+ start:991 stop:4143 length:3153 start_codon:yes stop_codon:yes gene_type:complete
MRICHLGDTHIRNLKMHYEYREVFDKLYDILREERVDYIIHCGDLCHTKTQISPEFVSMGSGFLRNLANIAPTYVILGNHDGNLRNSNRQDAITPIVDALGHKNLYLMKNSGETIVNDKLSLNVLSVFDTDNWVAPSDPTRINIALYHGSISGVSTDQGWVMEHGENDVSIFDGHDYALLGDIHKTNQILNKEGTIRYCGSTIQQNHGESNDKGFLLWDIKGKKDFTVKHISIPNPRPFQTIVLTPTGRLPKSADVKPGTRLRLVANNNIPLDQYRKTIDVAKSRFKPESVTYLNRAAGERGDVEGLANEFMKEDLRDVAVQEKFIKEYLKDYHPEEEVMERVLQLNKKYNTAAESEEEVARNVNWKLKSFEFDNLFNYGEGNRVDFSKLNGIVGIFGKNYSGKSSIVDGLLYTIYNSTSKNNRKNLHLINQTKDSCVGKIEIEVGNKSFFIERNSNKYERKLHGSTTMEAKTDIEFTNYDQVLCEANSLNGTTRNETDNNIRKVFGTMEDFLMTSMSSQLGSLSFISEGSTKRKEILAKFIDLEIFEKKYRMAKDDISDLRGALKRLEERDYDQEIEENQALLDTNEKETGTQKKECQKIKTNLETFETELKSVEDLINSIPAEPINITHVTSELKRLKNELISLKKDTKATVAELKDRKSVLKKIDTLLNDLGEEALRNKQQTIDEHLDSLQAQAREIQKAEEKATRAKKKSNLLNEVPCGEEFSHCKFIADAYKAKDQITDIVALITTLSASRTKEQGLLGELDPEKVTQHLEMVTQMQAKRRSIEQQTNDLTLKTEKDKTKSLQIEQEQTALFSKKNEYEENKEAIENLGGLIAKKRSLNSEISACNSLLGDCEGQLLELHKKHGYFEQKLENINEQKEELRVSRENFAAYELFMKCVHPNGIPYDIIKKKLPFINEEILKTLTNIVDFEVFFEAEGKKLEIFIKHPRYEARPIELGSGAEKTIAAMAIRLALLSVSNLPKSDIFILDEPGTSLDEDNMEGFVRILDMVKSHFNTVLLISHLDSLKDCVDMTIDIDQQEGYAFVNQ